MRRLRIAFLLLIALVGLARPGAGAPADPFEALDLVRFDSGIRAPAFTLPDVGGHRVSVSSPAGSAALVVFWATW